MPERPFPGLRSFEPHEFGIFFGRDDHINTMIDLLERNRFLCISGPSGCGKSSLARTGLFSGLKAGILGGMSDWIFIDAHPANAPFHQLADAIARAVKPELDAELGEDYVKSFDTITDLLREYIVEGRTGLRSALELFAPTTNRPVLLLIDQFEEIFTFEQSVYSEKLRFIQAILSITEKTPSLNVYVAITIRTDALEHCSHFDGLAERVNAGQFLTPALGREELKEVFQGPIALFNAEIDEGFSGWLLNEMAYERDRLPLLQHCLRLLWDSKIQHSQSKANEKSRPTITRADFDSVFPKVLENANERGDALRLSLSSTLDAIYNSPRNANLRPIIRKIFCALVDPLSQNRDRKRSATLAELVEIVGAPRREILAAVDLFRRPGRFYLRPNYREVEELRETDTISVMHECLLRQWHRLRQDWLAEERRSIDNLKHLVRSAYLYKKGEGGLLSREVTGYFKRWFDDARPTRAWAVRHLDDIDWTSGGVPITADAIFERTQEYLQTSIDFWARRRRNYRRSVVAGLGASMMAAAAFAVVQFSFIEEEHNDQLAALTELAEAARSPSGRGPIHRESIANDVDADIDSAVDGASADVLRAVTSLEALRQENVAAVEDAQNEDVEPARGLENAQNGEMPIPAERGFDIKNSNILAASIEGEPVSCDALLTDLKRFENSGDLKGLDCLGSGAGNGQAATSNFVDDAAIGFFDQGRKSLNRGALGDARQSFKEAGKLEPSVPRLYRYIAWTHLPNKAGIGSSPQNLGEALTCFKRSAELSCDLGGQERNVQLYWTYDNLAEVFERQDRLELSSAITAQSALILTLGLETAFDDTQWLSRKGERLFKAAKGMNSAGSCNADGVSKQNALCAGSDRLFERASVEYKKLFDLAPDNYDVDSRASLRVASAINSFLWNWATDRNLREKLMNTPLETERFVDQVGKIADTYGSVRSSFNITASMIACMGGQRSIAERYASRWPTIDFASRRELARGCIDEMNN